MTNEFNNAFVRYMERLDLEREHVSYLRNSGAGHVDNDSIDNLTDAALAVVIEFSKLSNSLKPIA